jgi:thiopeptide-type bacteriocin biosynthesis protein
MATKVLFRLPLIDFDIYDGKAIESHFPEILEKIRVSSQDFFQCIKYKSYGQLSGPEKKKLTKYLIRGKYRSTPFGKWTSVGLGNFGTPNYVFSSDIDFVTPTIEDSTWAGILYIFKENLVHGYLCKLNPNIIRNKGFFQYRYFDHPTGSWLQAKVRYDGFLEQIFEYLQSEKTISYEDFLNANPDDDRIKEIWTSLVKGGFLTISTIQKEIWDLSLAYQKANYSVNGYSESSITLPKEIETKLKVIENEMGNLFVKRESPVMENFENRFIKEFDDKYVPLNWLLESEFKLEEVFEVKNPKPIASLLPQFMVSKAEAIDLKDWTAEKKFENFHLMTISFRIDEQERMVCHNILCDRVFAYLGRFSRWGNISDFITEEIMPAFVHQEVEYFEVKTRECESTQVISQSRTLFDKVLVLESNERPKAGELTVNDLILGKYGDDWILLERGTNKRMIPVFPNAISNNWLSHPLAKLLWEIGLQSTYRLQFYQDHGYLDLDYSPRICWGDIILYPRKWIIKAIGLKGIDCLKDYFKEKNIPDLIYAGEDDFELNLDMKRQICWEILWEEMKRTGKIQVRESLNSSSPFSFKNNSSAYPELIYNLINKNPKVPKAVSGKVNSVINHDKNWVSYHVYGLESYLNEFITEDLQQFLSEIKENGVSMEWFYLAYEDQKKHIRLRFRIEYGCIQKKFEALFCCCIIESGLPLEFERKRYFPEVIKYGEDGVRNSEIIFSIESQYFTQKSTSANNCLVLNEDSNKIWFAICIWIRIFEDLGEESGFLHEFQKRYKMLSIEQRRKHLKMYHNLKKGRTFTANDELFISSTVSEFNHHPHLKECRNSLLQHHLHMFCNRLLLWDTQSHEASILYGISRELKKRKAIK